MALALLGPNGPEPPLQDNEYLKCAVCPAVFSAVGPVPIKEGMRAGTQCPACGERKGFVRHQHGRPEHAVDQRWPGSTQGGWTPIPRTFHQRARALGLSLPEVGLIDALEAYRRTDDEPVFVSYKRLARETGSGQSTVKRLINGLVERGLIEREHRKRSDGGNSTCALTRHGLTRALAHIAQDPGHWDEANDRWVVPGLDELLRELVRHPRVKSASGARSDRPMPRGQIDPAEVEAVGQEAEAQELLTERDSGNLDFPDLRLVPIGGAA